MTCLHIKKMQDHQLNQFLIVKGSALLFVMPDMYSTVLLYYDEDQVEGRIK